jgi:hypothetical protein
VAPVRQGRALTGRLVKAIQSMPENGPARRGEIRRSYIRGHSVIVTRSGIFS